MDIDLSFLGLCRRAGKLALGHDAAKLSLRAKRASLLVLAQDASDRLKEEMSLMADIPVIYSSFTIQDISTAIGRRAAVFTVEDENLAVRLQKNKED